MFRSVLVLALSGLLGAPLVHAQQADAPSAAQQKAAEEFKAKLRALDWIKGPTTVAVSGIREDRRRRNPEFTQELHRARQRRAPPQGLGDHADHRLGRTSSL